jgi:hypothetical protein
MATAAAGAPPTPPPPPAPYGGTTPPGEQRPLGITILAILAVLLGIAGLLGGLGSFTVGAVLGSATFSALGGVAIILGLVWFATAYGLWTGKRWGWTIALILAIISVIENAVSIAFASYASAFGLVIALIIIYYLTRPHVKAFFGRGPTTMPPPSTTPTV